MDYILGICLVFMVAITLFATIDMFIQISKIKSDDEDNEYHKLDPKEKAYELRDKFHAIHFMSLEMAKESALIAVDEILTTLNDDIRDLDVRGNVLLDLIRYWRNVKKEIKKL